jgi:hypothetical protein
VIKLKTFSELFENDDNDYNWSPDPSVHYPIEQIRGLESYKNLISKYGWIDTTTDRVAKSGNITFEHPVLSGIRYQIYNNGYVRINSGSRWTPLVSPIQDRGREFAEPIKDLNDYDLKFKWLEKYLIKKILINLELNRVRGISASNVTSDELGKTIDNAIEKNPTFAKKPGISTLINIGLYKPAEFAEDMMKASGLGLF